MRRNDVIYLAGSEEVIVRPVVPFDQEVCEFLETLSKEILRDAALKAYTDVVSFAFWIRKGNMQKQKELYEESNGLEKCRIGKGLIFHIAPSNVPINFAYSFVFGLLAGNSNIVRVSSKNFPQAALLCKKVQEVMNREEYASIKQSNAIIKYERNKEITDYFSSVCDIRVIWGGDLTIEDIRKSPMKARSKEIVFADRYSFGIICPDAILEMSEKERGHLAEQFYNDTYLMDQNACSTPHFILWKSDDADKVKKAQQYFWSSVYETAKKYDLADIKASDKYTDLCLFAVRAEENCKVKRYGNLLYVVDLEKIPEEMTNLRGRFGMFYQCRIENLREIRAGITEKVQTVAVVGVNKQEIWNFVMENHLTGIDRIVPFGSTLDIGLVWDGYDLVSEMSRIII